MRICNPNQKLLSVGALLSLSLSLSCLQLKTFANSEVAMLQKDADSMTKAQDEACSMLKAYLKINTVNPPGNEAEGAQYLAKILNINGIETKLFETSPNRQCIYARLKGNGKKKALILLNHIDVVPAQAEDWRFPPLSGEEHEGEIWGRGTLDMKGFAIAQLETMLMFKRSGKLLDRDIIFLGTPDEEIGGKFGAEWFAHNHPDLVKDAEFLLNEGAFIDTASDGKVKYWGVDISEKSPLWLSLKAKGEAGHASMPMADSSVNRLVRSLEKIVDNPPKPTILPAVREYFKKISTTADGSSKELFANIDDSVLKPDKYSELLKDKMKSSMLRNTISATVLKSGYKTNVIPAEAVAELDCRLLPGVEKDNFINNLKETMKDPNIEISVLEWVHTDASPYDTDLYKAIIKIANKENPGAPVVPMVMPWFTDSHNFRNMGIVSYGCIPFRIDAEHLATMHGKNERIPVSVFRDGVRCLYEIVEELCQAKVFEAKFSQSKSKSKSTGNDK